MFKGGERRSIADDKYGILGGNPLKYPHRLNFYDKPPTDDVTLEEFEICAIDRLRLLAEIESSMARNRSWEELKSVTNAQCLKYLPLSPTSSITVDRDAERRRDHLGHFVLRLAFCRSEDLRRRFVKVETTLFKIRYESDSHVEREAFLSSRDFQWISVDKDEKERLKDELLTVYSGGKGDAFNTEKYYKVRWTRVPDLIEKRKVVLKAGWAYVPGREQSSIVFQEFQTLLEKALELTARSLPRLEEDNRLVPILDNLSQGFLGGVSSVWDSARGEGGDEIKAEMVDEIARKHYPMCMRSTHENLRRDNHLKHYGRLQYGLFLKVLGLSIDEAIAFWRKAFSKKTTDDKFNKEYKYNIRHSFGLEGKRANYPARSCQQILTGPSDHGCPYRHHTPENLQTALLASYSHQGLTTTHLSDVMSTVKDGHFHVACTRVFEITHSSCGIKRGEGLSGESVTHPNQYAAKSIELEKSMMKTEESELKMDIT